MLAVDAALVAESAGLRLRIDGSGSVLTCRVTFTTGTVLPVIGRSREFLATLRLIIPVLERTGLRLDIVAGSVRLAQVGSGVPPNALARLMRLPATRLGA